MSTTTQRPRRARRMMIGLSAALLASAALAGCGNAGSSGSSGSSAGDNTIRVVYDWPGIDFEAVPIVVGQKEGFYKKHGVNVQLILPPDSATTVKMIASGKGDIGFDTTSDVVFARAQGIGVTSIANYSQANNWGLVAPPGSPIDISNINGKSFGIFTDSWTKSMMPYVLKAGNVQESQVKQVIFQNEDLPAMMAHKIDYATNTLNYAIAQIESETGKKPATLLATKFGAPDVPIWVYTAMDSWLSSHAKQAKAFLAATKEATEWAIANPTKAVDDFVAAYPNNGSSKKYNQIGWAETVPVLKGSQGLFTQNDQEWSQLTDALKGAKLLTDSSAPSTYYTNKYLG